MPKSFIFGIMVAVLLLIFIGVAMPEIQKTLNATQATGSGISPPLDLAMSNFSIILPLGFISIATAVLVLGIVGRR